MADHVVARLTVVERASLSPHLLRLWCASDDAEIRGAVFDDRLTLGFPDPDTGAFKPPELKNGRVHWPFNHGVRREYTIAALREDALAIDFYLHEAGVAAAWAQEAQIGATVWAAGPKSDTQVPTSTNFHILLGDETALPAIARRLAELDSTAQGAVAIEIADRDDERELLKPEGISLTWLHRVTLPSPGLGDFLNQLSLPSTGVYLWAAGEKGSMKPIRIWAREHHFDRSNCNISGYWRAN